MRDCAPSTNDLEHSVALNVHVWSEYPESNAAVASIFDELMRDAGLKGRERIKKKHIKIVLLNLWANWLKDQSLFTAYSRDRTYYFKNRRYQALHISPATIEVVDAMRKLGYVDHRPGYFNRTSHEGRQSRMRATDKLITLVTTAHYIPAETIHSEPDTECIILRNRNGWDVKYEETDETRRWRERLQAYNACLAAADISPPPGEKPGPDDRFVRRIFNNGSWNDGGRFYGGWWQGIPWRKRVQISIDRSASGSVELDYSGHHIALLYAARGINYWSQGGSDPYKLDGWGSTERMRSFLKLVLLIAINSESRKSALGALWSKIRDYPDQYGWVKTAGINVGRLIDAFEERHAPIRDCFYSNAGIGLQRQDSDVAEKIINHFTRQHVPVLCIHDSFVIHPAYEDQLRQVMTDALSVVPQENGVQMTPSLNRKTVADLSKPALALDDPSSASRNEEAPWVKLSPPFRPNRPSRGVLAEAV